MRDTTPDAESIRLAAVRRIEPAERLRQVFDWSEFVRRLALAGLKERYPGRSELELVEMLLGTPLLPTATRTPPR